MEKKKDIKAKKLSEMDVSELSTLCTETKRMVSDYDTQIHSMLKKGDETIYNNYGFDNNEWIKNISDKRNKLYALHELINKEIEKRLIETYYELNEKN